MSKIVTPVTDDKTAVPEVMTIKNFRSNGDIENFYRFVNDNDLRREAKIMLEIIQSRVLAAVKKKKKETNAQNKKNNLH